MTRSNSARSSKPAPWTPDPGDPVLHVPTGKVLTLARILKMNGHTYYVCRKPEPYVGPPHVMLPATDCTRPQPKTRTPRPQPEPEQEP